MNVLDRATAPLARMWGSDDAFDAYGLYHLASAAGDAVVAIALANSVFFSLPVGQAKVKVALYLALTMAPLAVAGPLLVPFLDRGGFRRVISFVSAAGRTIVALYLAPRVGSVLLFPAAVALLVLSKVNTITRNGLTMAYAPSHQGLVKANARLGRLGVVAALLAAIPAVAMLKLDGSTGVVYVAASFYGVATLLVVRLPHPHERAPEGSAGPRGRVPALALAAVGAAGLRAASGFLLFLLAFALRRSGQPRYWFGLLAAGATIGGLLGDLVAPRLPRAAREEVVVLGALLGAGAAALLAYEAFSLPVLVLFAALAGMATEFGRLAFQSLMQRTAPGRAQGRVFVRYEVAFQLSWVVGALIPALSPVTFRTGILLLALFYLLVGAVFVLRARADKATTT